MTSRDPTGFTGTREGMTPAQRLVVLELLQGVKELHHGGAVGADEEVHWLACGEESSLWVPKIVVHPCHPSASRLARDNTVILPRKPPLVRNRDIVDVTVRLIATPEGYEETKKSGTWATVRYALKKGKPLIVIWPDGTVTGGSTWLKTEAA